MKERPIIFSGPMVRAILEGRKTQTRRVVRNPERLDGLMLAGEEPDWCPYGGPGDHLWVRETWAEVPTACGSLETTYAADYTDGSDRAAGVQYKSPIHMPRLASRLTLEVTGVRVERLQEITVLDIREEGLRDPGPWSLHRAFGALWDTVNAKRGYPWESNPWVWVVEFTPRPIASTPPLA